LQAAGVTTVGIEETSRHGHTKIGSFFHDYLLEWRTTDSVHFLLIITIALLEADSMLETCDM